MSNRNRVVITIAGSDSDDLQLIDGLKLILKAQQEGKINFLEFDESLEIIELETCINAHLVISAHRHPGLLNIILMMIAEKAAKEPEIDYFIVCAAGMLAVLPSVAAGILYNEIGVLNGNVFVVGVGLEYKPDNGPVKLKVPNDNYHFISANYIFKKGEEKLLNDLAAKLSLTQAPGSLVICQDYSDNVSTKNIFFGKKGFTRACIYAIKGDVEVELRGNIIKAHIESKKNFSERKKKPSCRSIVKIIKQIETGK